MTTQSQPAASLRETAQRLGDEAIQLAEALIAHPSEIVPNGGTEGPAQHFLADFLKDKGYDTIDVFTPDSVAGARNTKLGGLTRPIRTAPMWWLCVRVRAEAAT